MLPNVAAGSHDTSEVTGQKIVFQALPSRRLNTSDIDLAPAVSPVSFCTVLVCPLASVVTLLVAINGIVVGPTVMVQSAAPTPGDAGVKEAPENHRAKLELADNLVNVRPDHAVTVKLLPELPTIDTLVDVVKCVVLNIVWLELAPA